jgi:hypothetical protein
MWSGTMAASGFLLLTEHDHGGGLHSLGDHTFWLQILIQWRIRHELLRQTLMATQRKLKGRSKSKIVEAIELIDAALVADKRGSDNAKPIPSS